MSVYSSADLLTKELTLGNGNRSLVNIFNSFLFSLKKSVNLEINIPATVYLRTKHICAYIEDTVGLKIGVENILMALYLEFIDKSLIEYDIMSVYKIINTPNSTDKIKISNGSEVWECDKYENKKCKVTIEIEKKTLLRGELLLAEIHELYGRYFSIEKVIATIWINFINNFLKGNMQDVLDSLIDILKHQM